MSFHFEGVVVGSVNAERTMNELSVNDVLDYSV